jgi:hypothetical protein
MARSPRPEEDGIFVKREKINKISFFAIIFIIIGFSIMFFLGSQVGTSTRGLAYYTEIDNCLIYSGEVYLSDIPCETNSDCLSGGVCLQEYGYCAFFVE